MKNLFEPAQAESIRSRLAQLRADSPRGWGKMTAPQMLAHCATAMDMAVGDLRPPRSLIGRVLGQVVMRKLTRDDAPIGKNSPTAKELVIGHQPEFEAERARLLAVLNRFTSGGPAKCTTYPHTFFGPMTPEQWAIIMYKHLDHHLRQFSA